MPVQWRAALAPAASAALDHALAGLTDAITDCVTSFPPLRFVNTEPMVKIGPHGMPTIPPPGEEGVADVLSVRTLSCPDKKDRARPFDVRIRTEMQ